MGGWGRPTDYVKHKIGTFSKYSLITDQVGGVKKGQNLDYVIFEWSLAYYASEISTMNNTYKIPQKYCYALD